MERETSEHLQTAERNRDFARSLPNRSIGSLLPGPRYEWVTVIAFYAAVHYVNAYLWERYRVRPRNHAERGQYVTRDPVLRRCARAYDRLQDAGFKSRYTALYRIPDWRAEGLVNVDLAEVGATVRAAI